MRVRCGLGDGCLEDAGHEDVSQVCQVRYTEWARRDGREAEGGGLLNRYRAKSSIEGSNPSLSARQSAYPICSSKNNRIEQTREEH